LDIKHSTTTPGHQQCNTQAEVFNKTMAKYLASFVYNTSYHSTIATTPYELLCGMKPRKPFIMGHDIQNFFCGESFAAERLQFLQKVRQISKEHIDEQQKNTNNSMTKMPKLTIFQSANKFYISKLYFLERTKN